MHPLLRELHASMLAVVLLSMDKEELRTLRFVTRPLQIETTTSSSSSSSSSLSSSPSTSYGMSAALIVGTCIALASSDDKGKEKGSDKGELDVDSRQRVEIQSLLLVGDAWVEVLRVLLAARSAPSTHPGGDIAEGVMSISAGASVGASGEAGRKARSTSPAFTLTALSSESTSLVTLDDYWDPLDEAEHVIKRMLDAVTETAKAAIALYQQQHPTRASAGGDGDGMALALASDQLYEVLVAIKKGRYDDRQSFDATATVTTTTAVITITTTVDGNRNSGSSGADEGSRKRLESLAADTREIFRQAEASLVDSRTESGQDQCEVGRRPDPPTLLPTLNKTNDSPSQ